MFLTTRLIKSVGVPACSPAPHLELGEGLPLEELLHPELEVEAKTVEDRPDVNDLTGSQPQGGDGERGNGGDELLDDVVVVLSNVVIHVPNGQRKWSVLPVVKEDSFSLVCPPQAPHRQASLKCPSEKGGTFWMKHSSKKNDFTAVQLLMAHIPHKTIAP